MTRLLEGANNTRTPLDAHEARFGSSANLSISLADLSASGLTGHGGAGVPTHLKVAFLRQQSRGVGYVVVNAMEGEPASQKDRTLLLNNPHLVLDGAMVLANLLDADSVLVCVPRNSKDVAIAVNAAIAERGSRKLRGPSFELFTPPDRFIGGEESALVSWLDSRNALPTFRPEKPSLLRIGRRGVLVDNAETHAHVGLIARRGPDWFRQVGTPEQPGTALVTVSGNGAPKILEVPYGTPIEQILSGAGVSGSISGVLVGGFGGSWISGRDLATPFDNHSLKSVGASVGAGILVALGPTSCGIAETARIADYMARESARQCGPCAFGLPAIADDLASLRVGRGGRQVLKRILERCGQVDGRGACRHPDGTVRMVRSALSVFATDAAAHADGRPCLHATGARLMPIPHATSAEDLEWS